MFGRVLAVGCVGVGLLGSPAFAIDHNNLDAGRPLRFDDAESLAFRERAFETGFGLGFGPRRSVGVQADAEFLYGLAPNSHVLIGFDPSAGGRAGSRDTRFDPGDLALGYFHNFNRELEHTPAYSLRADAFLPTGRGSRGVGLRLRGIASKIVTQYDRLHLNVDLNGNPSPAAGERTFYPSATLGWSRPLGYPRTFTRTGLASISVSPGQDRGTGPVVTLGAGIRQQIGLRSVVDVGLESDVAGWKGAPRDAVRVIANYSIGF